ncbi:putative quinol monooxygenase [Actinoplanes sp. NPDC051513]|uniref:putative quinol monooxygenase n=1 Tax=Actinoplanes sp. NPDC051513 TaxID=3363908 RepID=UPI00378BAC68
MTIRHIVTIQVAADQTASFATAFKALQAVVLQEDGCEQYELFQSQDDPDKMGSCDRCVGGFAVIGRVVRVGGRRG